MGTRAEDAQDAGTTRSPRVRYARAYRPAPSPSSTAFLVGRLNGFVTRRRLLRPLSPERGAADWTAARRCDAPRAGGAVAARGARSFRRRSLAPLARGGMLARLEHAVSAAHECARDAPDRRSWCASRAWPAQFAQFDVDEVSVRTHRWVAADRATSRPIDSSTRGGSMSCSCPTNASKP